MNTYDTAALRAEAGALFLDQYRPGWAQRLSKPISMASTHDCVLAQLFGRFRIGAESLHLNEMRTFELGFRGCKSELGNDLRAFALYYKALTAVWEHQKQLRLVA